MPKRTTSRSSRNATGERESALSLTLRGIFWAAVIALVLIAVSPTDLPEMNWSHWAWWRGEARGEQSLALLPTSTGEPSLRVGVISGHWKNDSGATCPDGLKEVDVNHAIALRVEAGLREAGYQVDLLQEKDPRLEGYQAAALISIHADVCDPNPDFTGFKTSPARGAEDAAQLQNSLLLKACIDARYGEITGLPYHPTSVSRHMTEYYAFDTIAPTTPAVIIETGFLGMDRNLLVNHPDVVAKGIVAGVLCYLRNEPVTTPTPSPTPVQTSTPNP